MDIYAHEHVRPNIGPWWIGSFTRAVFAPAEDFPRENTPKFRATHFSRRTTKHKHPSRISSILRNLHQLTKKAPRTRIISPPRGVAMKGRAVKLREAHKAGSPSFCSVAWAPGGQHVVTASAADVAIQIHDAAAVSAGGRGSGSAAALSTIRLHKDGVTAVALAPGSGGSLASGSIDHSVKFYSFPGTYFDLTALMRGI